MRVTYVGHATVLIEDSGSAIVTDPLLRRRVGHLRRQGELPAPLPELDGVLISHLHRDHLDTPSLKRIADGTPVVVPASGVSAIRRTRLQPLPVEEGGELRLGAFRVLAVPADHPTRRTPLGQETDALGYVLTAPGGSVYFAGDTDLFEGMRAIGDLGLDVALLPVAGWGPTLGPGHMDARAAAEAAALIATADRDPDPLGDDQPGGDGRLRRPAGTRVRRPRRRAGARRARGAAGAGRTPATSTVGDAPVYDPAPRWSPSRSTTSPSATATTSRSTASASRSSRARRSASSAPTAPARPPPWR